MAEARKKPVPTLYQTDFFAWTREQGAKLRARAHNDIDWENAAEEIESLGRSEQREIVSRLVVALLHLLKWQYQPDKRKGGWRASIWVQRYQLRKVLAENPSLAGYPGQELSQCYEAAKVAAEEETGLAFEIFPVECPYAVEQVLDDNFWPEGR